MKCPSQRVVIFILAMIVSSACSSGSNIPQASQDLDRELSAGARAFQARNYRQAEEHFRRALDLDPANQKATILLARLIESQYRRDDPSPENIVRAEEALETYKRVLSRDPNNDEAASAVFFLLKNLEREDESEQFAEERARNSAVSAERRSDTYVFLATRKWDCAYSITEMGGNKQTIEKKDGSISVQYTKPRDPSAFFRARQCTTEGLELIEQAIALNPKSAMAWSYKVNLLVEARKLAQMDGNAEQQAEYTKMAEEAVVRARELTDKQRGAETRASVADVTGFDSLVPPVDHILTLVEPEPQPAPAKTK